MTDGLPSPLVDYIPPLQWFTLQSGVGNMLKSIVTIDAAGSTTLNGSSTTYNDIYVDTAEAAGAVNITMPLPTQMIEGQEWFFKDTTGQAANFPFTVLGNGYEVDAGSSFTVNFPYASVSLVWNGTAMSVKT